ncbi:G2/mitotic-specific cyclin [Thoreauomyces humboldtii]|nr:G2/mitotic-specific cyclin [Thoreauomyces humboldtii]
MGQLLPNSTREAPAIVPSGKSIRSGVLPPQKVKSTEVKLQVRKFCHSENQCNKNVNLLAQTFLQHKQEVVEVIKATANVSTVQAKEDIQPLKAPKARIVEVDEPNKENAVTLIRPKAARSLDDAQVPVAKRARSLALAVQCKELDAQDHLFVGSAHEYADDIFEYMRNLEKTTMPDPDYMETVQNSVTWQQREVLVDWLIEISHCISIQPETLFTAVNILDRFMSQRAVSEKKLQLVGLAALFIACKYEEVQAPAIKTLLYYTDGAVSYDSLLAAERYILKVLRFGIMASLCFRLSYPSPMSFLRRCSKADDYDQTTRILAKYFMEITLLDHIFLSTHPSKVAAAAMYLARDATRKGEWSDVLNFYSGYTEDELYPVVEDMRSYLQKGPSRALFKKYSSKRYNKAALFVQRRFGHP